MSFLKRRWPVGLAALVLLGCSDDATGHHFGPVPPPGSELFPQLIVSEPVTGGGPAAASGGHPSGDPGPVFVSLPPGTLADAVGVVIRNLTEGGFPTADVPVTDGGFDPVPIHASEGDTLELEIRDSAGAVLRKYGTVPRSRPPVVVRVSPPQGRTDVALSVRPIVVFSEPIEGSTLDAIRLRTAATVVESGRSLVPGMPWVVKLDPGALLLPATTYHLDILDGIRDLGGEALVEPVTATFTTVAEPAPAPPGAPGPQPQGSERIAFSSTRDGGPAIYLANADGSGVVRLTAGGAPAWAPDGSKLAFSRYGGGPSDVLGIINADGTGLVTLGPGFDPQWSPDGARLTFWDYSGIWVMNADGSGRTRLLPNDHPDCLTESYSECSFSQPVWSPDGGSIAFIRMSYGPCGAGCGWPAEHWWLYVMGADGSSPHPVDLQVPAGMGFGFGWGRPAWAPDGDRLGLGGVLLDESLGQWRHAVVSVTTDGADFQVHHLAPPGWGTFAPSPRWSPDGSAILFELYQLACSTCGIDLAGPTRIYVAEGGAGTQLIPEATTPADPDYLDRDPDWSPRPD